MPEGRHQPGHPRVEPEGRLSFNWKKKFEGMTPPEMRRLKQLEDENTKLRKLVADLSLDREMLQDVIRRKLWGLVASASLSTRCGVSGTCRSGGLAG